MRTKHVFTAVFFGLLIFGVSAIAQTTAFTYQGRLTDTSVPASGTYQMRFALYDAPAGGTQIGSTIESAAVAVSNGVFTVQLDYGTGMFPGPDRYLEISVRRNSGEAYVVLGPRQRITSGPYAIRASSAGTADNALSLGGTAAGNYVQTSDSRLSDARTPTAGSSHYIQNQNAGVQASSNFSISGSGTASGTLSASVVNAGTQYNLAGIRVLSTPGTRNLFVGKGVGPAPAPSPPAGTDNTYFGTDAGASNITPGGSFNSFFGSFAGNQNQGSANSFFGDHAGQANASGEANSYFGARAGQNSNGSSNSFFGSSAGTSNTFGAGNSFFGTTAGSSNTSGSENSFFGFNTGSGITTNHNSFFGARATGAAGINNATAIGHRAFAGQSNSLILGSINGINSATADTNVGIGTTTPARRLHVANGSSGAVSLSSADFVIEDNAAAFQHFLTPDDSESGLLFGDVTDSIAGGIIFNNAATNNGMQFRAGGNTTRMTLDGSGNLGIGIGTPADKLHVVGDVRVGTGTTGCVKDADGTVIAGTCSSDGRLKKNISGFSNVLDKIVRLRPVNFYWRADEFRERSFGTSQSFGLVAQEVNEVMPELVTTDDQGFAAVRYNKLPLLLLQGIKELKTENDRLTQLLREEADTNEQQQKQIAELKQIVCTLKPDAPACQETNK